MDKELKPGIKLSMEIIVGNSQSARTFGSGMVDVLATPAMIALMEKTALESVHPYLDEGFTTVGTEIHIKHLKATPIGEKVTCDSRLREVNGRKLVFELHTWDKKGMVGIGTHTRVIVDERLFMEKLK
jgi:predicted thioesterase